ncbi:MAG: pantoate--beta-alanine ligase, partial [Jiangellales bacterium]
ATTPRRRPAPDLMRLLRTRDELLDARIGVADESSDVAAVLTMGALHAGHRGLIEEARRLVGESGTVVLTVFVNPLQFGAGEDLERYPRALDTDLATAEQAGVDLVFVPDAAQVYPDGPATITVDPGELGTRWEGAARPTHFRGVLTVVAKLLNLVVPSVTVFGEKDYQQLVLVRRMCRELELGVEVVGLPTVREPDGLALSSRNAYLNAHQRQAGLALSRALRAAQQSARASGEAALAAAHAVLQAEPDVDVDYLVLTDPELADPPLEGDARMLVAARVGTTRLLDNMALTIGGAR